MKFISPVPLELFFSGTELSQYASIFMNISVTICFYLILNLNHEQ